MPRVLDPARPRTLRVLGAIGVTLCVVATGCGGDDTGGDGEAAAATIKATLSEFAIELSTSSVQAGSVTFEATNAGTIGHELVIVQSEAAVDALPQENGKVIEDDVTVVDEIEEFAAGKTESKTVELAAGTYYLICNIPGHYAQGMYATLNVT